MLEKICLLLFGGKRSQPLVLDRYLSGETAERLLHGDGLMDGPNDCVERIV